MIGTEHLQTIVGSNAVDNDGDKLGKIGNVYLDDRTGEPAWATVNTGLFGTKESFVPLATARIEGDQLVVPFDKAKVKDAPKVADDGHIGDDEQEELYRYYGLSSANGHDGTPRATPVRRTPAPTPTAPPVSRPPAWARPVWAPRAASRPATRPARWATTPPGRPRTTP